MASNTDLTITFSCNNGIVAITKDPSDGDVVEGGKLSLIAISPITSLTISKFPSILTAIPPTPVVVNNTFTLANTSYSYSVGDISHSKEEFSFSLSDCNGCTISAGQEDATFTVTK